MDSEAIAKAAKEAFVASQLIQSAERIKALKFIQQELDHAKQAILAANAEDLKVGSLRTHDQCTILIESVGRSSRSRCRTNVSDFAQSPGSRSRRQMGVHATGHRRCCCSPRSNRRRGLCNRIGR